MSDVEQII